MKIKLDENLPAEVADLLLSRGHDTHTVAQELLVGRVDDVIIRAAINEDRVLLTQDLDFSDLRKFKPGTHSGIVLIRLRDPSRRRIIERVEQILNCEQVENWRGCFIVISDRKLRIRRP